VLLREDVPQRALVIISQADNIYDTARVAEYLEAGRVDLKLFPDTQHGGWILDATQISEVLHEVATLYTNQPDHSSVAGV
jgi:hypothetical protein